MSAKAEVLRRIAHALGAGAPWPLHISVVENPLSLLLDTRADFDAWAGVFDMHPVDCRYDDIPTSPGETQVWLANNDIELVCLVKRDGGLS